MTGEADLQLILDDLTRYSLHWKNERVCDLKRFRDFVKSTSNCCLRSHQKGHCTGSALIVNQTRDRVLLLFHPFLKRWLQPGGHADGNRDLLEVAHREAHEESGLPYHDIVPHALGAQNRVPLDLDIHLIPARNQEPAHYHYDLRFLFTSDSSLPLVPETPDLKVEWVPLEQVQNRTDEESVLRMIRKIQVLAP